MSSSSGRDSRPRAAQSPAIAVDPMGRTGHPRVWAAGNVVPPMTNVPLSMGAGPMADAAANAALTAEDADAAVADRRQARAAEWEERYAGSHKVWSGRVNPTLAAVVEPLVAGRALDLGCGEGADALWLAAHGWQTTGVDVSPTAVERARGHAEEQGLGGNAEFVVGRSRRGCFRGRIRPRVLELSASCMRTSRGRASFAPRRGLSPRAGGFFRCPMRCHRPGRPPSIWHMRRAC